ncbi:lysine--tRNA ligase [Candidatus Babeliales bacterium]|nr:lysine--tRNA ligase [Candidatus Babeliales bacterium]
MTKKENFNNNKNHEKEALSSEHEVRLEKIKKMIHEGINPWPAFKKIDSTCSKVIDDFDKNLSEDKEYSIAGRIMTSRNHGKTIFVTLQDRTGILQLYLKQDILGEKLFDFLVHYVDVGDIVWAKGSVFKTKMGEITLRVKQFSLLSKCLHPLPEKYHGLVDVEQRYRQRYLDLISNPDAKEKFKKRSRIIQTIRQFLLDRDFLEVETPMLHPIPGGATAKPFVTHHNAYDMDLYLRIAPELYLKRLVVGGFERVFEINRNFRNEGISTKHNPEFTMLEFYMAHGDYNDGIDLTEKLIHYVASSIFDSSSIKFGEHLLDFSLPFKRMTIKDSLIEIGKLNADQIIEQNIDKTFKENNIEIEKSFGYGKKLFLLFEHLVEDKIVQPTFITGHSIEVSPLAKRDEKNKDEAARFELFCMGIELANGFTELNDPFDQAVRFKKQVEAKIRGDEEAHHYDEDYIKTLEYGLPPTVGVGLGIDRITMLLTDTNSIKDVILFPTLKSLE